MSKSVVGNSKRKIWIAKSISGDVARNIQWQWMIWWTLVVVESNTTFEEHGSTRGHLRGWKVAFSFEWWLWYPEKNDATWVPFLASLKEFTQPY